jgi:DNA invertase Pin-like site-specific DNA recombinase
MLHKTALIIPGQGIDTSESNPASKFQLDILMAVAEFEKETIRERINAGLKAAKRRGVRLGRPSRPMHERLKVQKLRSEGKSIRHISALLNLPTSTVHRIVKQPLELQN